MGTGLSSLHGLTVEQIIAQIAVYLNERSISLRDAFVWLDGDGSGYVSWDEFWRGFHLCIAGVPGGVSITSEHVIAVFNRFDTNGDQHLSIDEFVAAFNRPEVLAATIGHQYYLNVPKQTVVQPVQTDYKSAWSVIERIASAIVRTGNDVDTLFNSLDVDGNRRLSRSELARMMITFQPDLSLTEQDAVFSRFDRNASGDVDVHEFAQALKDANPSSWISLEEKVKAIGDRFRERGYTLVNAFTLFDRDGDGFLTRDEWQRAIRLVNPATSDADIEAVFRRFATGGTGLMSVYDFQKFFQDAMERRAPGMPSTHAHRGVQLEHPPPVHPLHTTTVMPPPPPPPPPLATAPTYSAEAPWETEVLDLVKSCLSVARSGMTITEVFRRLDVDQSNEMSWSEFCRLIKNYRQDLEDYHIEQLFYRVNTSRTGSISMGEFVLRFG